MNYGTQLAGKAMRGVARVLRKIGGLNGGGAPVIPTPYRDFFSISIYSGASPLELGPIAGAETPVLTGSDVTDVSAVYVADPFMIRAMGCWNMFFEILREDDGKGVIGLATSRDGLVWDYQQVVLEEPFHLSYPCVFECDGDHFMIPESNHAGTVRLYKAEDFPTRWSHVCNLIENVAYVDCTPFRFDDRWWLFAGCGTPPLLADTLRLYHADQLTGPWTEHPASPVVTGNPHIARPGGRVIVWDNRLFRFAQDCSPRYGLNVRAFEITELTVSNYHERQASHDPILGKFRHGWNSAGMHHIDCHPADDGSCLACVDGWYWGPVPSGSLT